MRSPPWQVKGIDPQARESARDAARRSGKSVGQWLNSVILEQAVDEIPPPPGRRARAPVCHDENLAAINRRLDDLGRQLGLLTGNRRDPVSPRNQETPHRIAEAILQLNGRLDRIIAEGRSASSSLERRVNSVDRALANLTQQRLSGGYAGGEPGGIDQAVAEISARQRALDGEFAGTPSAALRPSAAMACRAEDAVGGLRKDLADIGRTLSEAMPRRAVEALETEVRALVGRLDAGRQPGVDAPALAGLEQGLHEVRDALRGLAPAESLVGFDRAVQLLSGKIDQIAARRQDPAGLQQLEAATASLRDVVGQVASGDALAALTREVRELAAKIERGMAATGSPDILRTLERQISMIADGIESMRSQNGRAASPNLDQLVKSLHDKLDNMQSWRPDPLSRGDQLALSGLEDRIARLVEKLDASEGRLGHLEAIERGMAELLVHLEGLRAAPALASRVERPEPAPVAPVPVEALSHDVAALKQAQATVERRTQDSLEVVHGTIETVVDRLATIETGFRNDQRGGVPAPLPSHPDQPPEQPAIEASLQPPVELSPQPSPPQPPVQPSPQPRVGPPVQAPAPAPVGRSAPPAKRTAVARPAMDPALPHDHPLEPGSGPPRPRPAQSGAAGGTPPAAASAADRVAASEAPLRAAKGAAPEPEPKSDYLQAARRAAQHASQAAQQNEAAAGSKLSQRLKTLFVGISIVALIVVALRIAATYFETAELALPAPALADRSAPAPAIVASQAGASSAAAPQLPAPLTLTVPVAPAPPSAPPPLAALPSVAESPLLAATPPSGVLAIDIPARQPPPAPAPAASAGIDAPPDVTGSIPASTPPHTGIGLSRVVPAAAPAVAGSDQLPAAIGSKMLVAAATGGEPAAAYEVATRLAEGRGVPQNFAAAAIWYERSAKGGLAPALFRLGAMYEKGNGVTKDLNEARRLYIAAAEKGNPNAMHNIGVLYAEGIDGKPDFKTAAQWFRKSSTLGIADSQYNLAVLYARGIGVERDLTEAYKWFALAAKGGDPEAGKKRDEIAARLDQASLAATRRAAETWVADQAPRDAVTVEPPPGGWDQAEPATKLKPRPRAQAHRSVVPL
ncbi:MAG TPA: tetratricopeptide repeat protein [Xanthobacteraceae bacterium]